MFTPTSSSSELGISDNFATYFDSYLRLEAQHTQKPNCSAHDCYWQSTEKECVSPFTAHNNNIIFFAVTGMGKS